MTIPSDFTMQKVTDKYDGALRLFVANKKRKEAGDAAGYRQNLNSAGQNLSSALEYAVKLHMQLNWNALSRTERDLYRHFSMPVALNLYKDKGGVPGSLYNQTCAGSTINPASIDFGLLNERKLYSNNTAHSGIDLVESDVRSACAEIGKFIRCYLDPTPLKREEDFEEYPEAPVNIYNKAGGFQRDNTVYVLVNEDKVCSSDLLQILMRINWSLVIDFDSRTFDAGHFGSLYDRNLVPNIICPDNTGNPHLQDKMSPAANVPVFYMADDLEKAVSGGYSQWVGNRKRKAERFVEAFLRSGSMQGIQSVVIVSLKRGRNYNSAIFESFFSRLGSSISLVYYIFDEDSSSLSSEFDECINARCTVADLCELLKLQLPERASASRNASFTVPYRKNDPEATGCLTAPEMMSYSTTFDVLTLGDVPGGGGHTGNRLDFFRGAGACPWEGVADQWPVGYPLLPGLIKTIRKWTSEETRIRLISHGPGIGGTTIVRMAAWELHTEFPVLWMTGKDLANQSAQLEIFYEKVKMSLIVFVEVPDVLEWNELTQLSRNINMTRRVYFIAIGRTGCSPHRSDFPIADWGNAMGNLVAAYAPYVDEMAYPPAVKDSKLKELDRLRTHARPEEKAPFIVALTTFDKDYLGIDSYVSRFRRHIAGNSMRRDVLGLLALCDRYGRPELPSQLLVTLFGSSADAPSSLKIPFQNTGITQSLIAPVKQRNGAAYWRMRNSVFTVPVLQHFFGLKPSRANLPEVVFDLASRLIKVVRETAGGSVDDNPQFDFYENILTKLLIQRTDFQESKYSPLLSDTTDQQKIALLESLHQAFPANPHFCSHLARAYTKIDKDYEKGLAKATEAINLSDGNDHVIFHMRAECYRNILKARKEAKTPWAEMLNPRKGPSLAQFVELAGEDYRRTRDLQKEASHLTVHGYDGHMKLYLTALEYAIGQSGLGVGQLLVTAPYSEWWEDLQALVEELEAEQSNIITEDGGNVQDFITGNRQNLHTLIGDYSRAIEIINNQLDKTPSGRLRRMAVMLYLQRPDHPAKTYRNNDGLNHRLTEMLARNLDEEVTLKDFYPWLELVRYSKATTIDSAIRSMNRWRSMTDRPLPILEFYLFFLNTVLAIGGSATAAVEAERALDNCRELRPNQPRAVEWAGHKHTPNTMAGLMVSPRNAATAPTAVFEGVVTSYSHAGMAAISIAGLPRTLDVYFNPKREGLDQSCLNKKVEFGLSFSYDGLRAGKVRLCE